MSWASIELRRARYEDCEVLLVILSEARRWSGIGMYTVKAGNDLGGWIYPACRHMRVHCFYILHGLELSQLDTSAKTRYDFLRSTMFGNELSRLCI